MNSVAVLHGAARQYCLDRSYLWRRTYADLAAVVGPDAKRGGGLPPPSARPLDVYPRYLTADAILAEVERFVPEDFASVTEAREYLAAAAETADDSMTRFKDPIAKVAGDDERWRFARFVTTVDPAAVVVRPLPFRRVLGTDESRHRHAALTARWGTWYGGGAGDQPADVETATLHEAAMEAPGSYDHLRAALVNAGYTRVFELREYDNSFELATDAADFQYTGAEGFWTAADGSWLVYASHEASITFGGRWLIDRMRAELPEFQRYGYKGWDLAHYGQSEVIPRSEPT